MNLNRTTLVSSKKQFYTSETLFHNCFFITDNIFSYLVLDELEKILLKIQKGYDNTE